ncbi:hypothetical protein Ciccas_002847 [Cichlidogyrus casuarinus]|uniref:Uncharacterized protein n=1 Tax=Cichlidogyrus casuarinus TaxID=1844966 RepID=A0ABD2QIC7_9PLAT
MSVILLTSISDKGTPGLVAWDFMGGNPIAALNGEIATQNTILYCNDGRIITATQNKPLLQYWNFSNPKCAHKNLTTKGTINTIVSFMNGEYLFIAIDKEIIMYQSSSGCLIVVFSGSHGQKITTLSLSNQSNDIPPLLLSSDIDGMMCCWSLAALNCDYTDANTTQKPFWFVVKACQNQCKSIFGYRNYIYSISCEGLKIFDPLTGDQLGLFLTDVDDLSSICAAPTCTVVYCGASDGHLYEVNLTVNKNSCSVQKDLRRCFVSENRQQKTITHLTISSQDLSIIVAGSKGGLIEVLRRDSCMLTRLQCFSVVPPGLPSAASCQLQNLLLVPRPQWANLKIGGTSTAGVDMGEGSSQSSFERRRDVLMEPFKRHMGWKLEDFVYMQVPQKSSLVDWNEQAIYGDHFGMAADFEASHGSNWLFAPYEQKLAFIQGFNMEKRPDSDLDGATETSDQSEEIKKLKTKIADLEHANKCLVKRLVREQTHF